MRVTLERVQGVPGSRRATEPLLRQLVDYALALSGGANNGAWEAGVLYGLINYGNPEDFKW